MPDLYIKYREETPYQYRYGDESEVMRLFIDGGIVRRRKQRKRGNKNKVTDYSPEIEKYLEWRYGSDPETARAVRSDDEREEAMGSGAERAVQEIRRVGERHGARIVC